MRDGLAQMLGADPETIRVAMVDVGGAFGPRSAPYPEYALLLHAARDLMRPVKWTATRSEDFLVDSHGRAIRLRGELAFDHDGRFLALRTHWLCDQGAYLTAAGPLTNTLNPSLIACGPYKIEHLYGRHTLILTNTAPTNSYRGAGRPDAVYLIERLVDEAAAVLERDPIELRHMNAIPKVAHPYRTPTGSVLDSGDYAALLERAASNAAWHDFPARRAEASARGRFRGIGCALFVEPSGGGHLPADEVAVQFDADGNAAVYVASTPNGQGHETVFADLLASSLGLHPDQIRVRSSDPDGPPITGNGTLGSRTVMSYGSALLLAADEVRNKGYALAAESLEASPDDLRCDSGTYRVKGTDRVITLTELARRYGATRPHPLDARVTVPIARNFASGAHVAEIEIDAETGVTQVIAYTAVDDIGTVVNETLAAGQVHGGVAQGAGQVFGERCFYDHSSGQLLTCSFMDYSMPRADLLGEMRVLNGGVRTPTNRLGAKGVGEAGTIGALPAFMNAVLDALRPAGVAHVDMPATPTQLWAALQSARSLAAKK